MLRSLNLPYLPTRNVVAVARARVGVVQFIDSSEYSFINYVGDF